MVPADDSNSFDILPTCVFNAQSIIATIPISYLHMYIPKSVFNAHSIIATIPISYPHMCVHSTFYSHRSMCINAHYLYYINSSDILTTYVCPMGNLLIQEIAHPPSKPLRSFHFVCMYLSIVLNVKVALF
jgi:hypothetical protein